KDLWDLINICATYSAEPGIFFIDNANDMTNAKAYGQQVVATNPCGEQPLAPYSVCNLAAINLAEMANKEKKSVDFDKLMETVKIGVRMQDNVRSEEHTSELQSRFDLVCRLLLEKKKRTALRRYLIRH